MTYGYIYKISFPNNKIYIGLTTTSIEQRHKEDKQCALGNSKPYLIYKALRKYDMIETFELEQIDTADTLEELCEKEKEYIKQYNSHYIEGNGYNMTYGGEGTNGYIYTEDDKKKNSESIKAYYEENPEAGRIHGDRMKAYYEENPETGRIHGDKMKAYYEENSEAREKVSERMKEYYKNPEARLKASEKTKKYYEENPDAIEKKRQAQIKYYKENPEAGRIYGDKMKKHHQENPNMRYEILDKKGQNKPFDVFTINGTFIKTFNYQIDARKYLQEEYNIDKQIKIGEVLSGKRKSTNGFVFKYKEIENI